MFRMLVIVLFFLLLCSIVTAQHSSVCLVGAGNSMGSGVLVSNDGGIGVVLTAAHVIRGSGQPWANFPKTQRRFLGSGVRYHPSEDIATFQIKTDKIKDRRAMPIYGADALSPGLPVWAESFGNVDSWPRQAIGEPLWKYRGIAFGRLSGQVVASTYVNKNIADLSIPAIPGDSGGVAFTTVKGQPHVVGIISASNWGDTRPYGKGPTFTLVTHCRPIRRFLGFGRNHPPPYQGQQHGYGGPT